MNFKKMIAVVLLISIFMMGAVSAMEETPVKKTTSKTSKVTKDSLKVSAPSVTNVYKKSQTFKVTVNNKNTGKAMKNVKANIKIGKKKYNKKTNSKGIISINTKALKKGTYKVVIKIKATKKYKKASAKSSIKIVSKLEKIKTKIKCEGSVTQKIRYRTVYNYGGGAVATVYLDRYPYVDITPTLMGSDGKKVAGNYKATIIYDSGSQDTFEGKFGEHKIYEGATGYGPYKLIINYDGDSNHIASTYSMTGE